MIVKLKAYSCPFSQATRRTRSLVGLAQVMLVLVLHWVTRGTRVVIVQVATRMTYEPFTVAWM